MLCDLRWANCVFNEVLQVLVGGEELVGLVEDTPRVSVSLFRGQSCDDGDDVSHIYGEYSPNDGVVRFPYVDDD